MKLTIRSVLVTMAVVGGSLGAPATAAACGGFFCSQVQPVNQAAERIIFADNGDGTQTAVIEIMYEGPSEHFSWLLPISSVPQGQDLGVASDIAFQRLQAATNPQYTLTTRVEGTCKPPLEFASAGASGEGPTSGDEGGAGGHAVTVEASGAVGPFEWTAISVDQTLSDPAAAAVKWLGDNGYDVPPGAPALLGPYLSDGLYLLALRLTKGADVGSIRPLSLTYEAARPMIPIKLTAVAANENMGVMTWVLGTARAVPQNYFSLELNEARINWFNPASNYDAVVTAAADDASGQGFVTELAAPTSVVAEVVWSSGEQAYWDSFKARTDASASDIFLDAYYRYGSFDGFWDVARATVTLPDGLTLEQLQACPSCNADTLELTPSDFIDGLEKQVIDPVKSVQTLLDAHARITRLYTTMSADEMTLDPLFTFNPELGDVSNVHTAERVIECDPSLDQADAPWHIELPQGGSVRGTPDEALSRTWPEGLANQPPNRLIQRVGETGSGDTIEDNSEAINRLLADYNATVPTFEGSSGADSSGSNGTGGGQGGTRSSSGGTGGGKASGGTGAKATGSGGTTTGSSGASDSVDTSGGAGGGGAAKPRAAAARDGGSGCGVTPRGGDKGALAGAIALVGLALRRRRVPRARA